MLPGMPVHASPSCCCSGPVVGDGQDDGNGTGGAVVLAGDCAKEIQERQANNAAENTKETPITRATYNHNRHTLCPLHGKMKMHQRVEG